MTLFTGFSVFTMFNNHQKMSQFLQLYYMYQIWHFLSKLQTLPKDPRKENIYGKGDFFQKFSNTVDQRNIETIVYSHTYILMRSKHTCNSMWKSFFWCPSFYHMYHMKWKLEFFECHAQIVYNNLSCLSWFFKRISSMDTNLNCLTKLLTRKNPLKSVQMFLSGNICFYKCDEWFEFWQ